MQSSPYTPKVSIIMNCFNGEEFLSKALDSIIHQTYNNWEVIFWDVSTSDKSRKIFESYDEKRFKYFNSGAKKNLYHSRNEAISESTGEILSFLDCDDWWLPKKLETQVEVFKDKNNSLVYSNYFEFNQKKNKIKTVKKNKIYSGFIQNKIIYDYHIGILTTSIRKDVFLKMGGFNNSFHLRSGRSGLILQ